MSDVNTVCISLGLLVVGWQLCNGAKHTEMSQQYRRHTVPRRLAYTSSVQEHSVPSRTPPSQTPSS